MIHRTRESIAADVEEFIRKHGESAIQKIPRGVMTDVEETRKERQDASDWFNRASEKRRSGKGASVSEQREPVIVRRLRMYD